MPSRGTYQVANIEEGKVIQRDQSYKSCILTLIIFLFLCIALIVIGLLSRKSSSYNEDEDLKSVEGYHNHYKDRTKGTTSTTESLQYSTVSNGTNEIQTTLKTTTTTIDVITSWTDTSHIFERLENPTTSPITTESVTDIEETRTSTTTDFVTKEEEILTSPITTDESVTKDEETSTSTTTEFVTEKEEILTSPITTETVTDVEETTTSTITDFVTKEEEILTSPITTDESVTKDEETSTSTTTEFVTEEEEILTSPITTETVTDVEETTTSTTTDFVTEKEEILTSPITTESVTDVEETTTSTTTDFVTEEEEILTSPITTDESVTKDEETSTSTTTTDFVTEEEEILTSPITTKSVTDVEEATTSITTDFVTEEEEILTSPITTDESVTKDEETSTSTTTTDFVTEEEEILTSPITTKSVTDVEETTTSTTTDFVTEEEEILTSPITTEPVTDVEETTTSTTTESVTNSEETSTSSTITTELTTNTDEESTVEASTTFTESATEISTVTTEKSGDVAEVETSTSTSSSTTDSEFSTETTLSTSGNEEETTVSSTMDSPQSTVQSEILSTTSGYEKETTVCTLGECKNLASKMLFYMNHSVDPCDDFYEYACGGFEANPRIGEVDSESVAYNRILRQLRQEIREEKSSLFTTYYDSCMRYETLILKEKIHAAKEALNNVGKFYTTDSLFDKVFANFTTLVGQLLLHNSALLFDVSPELNENDPRMFTLKIGPTKYKSPFEVDRTEDDPCYASQFERDQATMDLEKLYKEYKSCKNNTKELLSSIKEAFSAFGVFHELRNEYNISQHVETTVINIDIEIVQKFFANFPSKDQIRKAYLMKDYTNVSIIELQTNWKVINWLQLIKLLTNNDIAPEVYVQVYFYDALNKGLKNLEEFGSKSPMELNNALLGLYAQTLYQQLILPKHVDPKDYCLRVATKLLTPEASNLYISTFSKDELVYMNKTIQRLFEELKETLKLKVEESKWTKEDRGRLVAKIDNLKVVTPDISYFGHNESVYGSMKADNKLTDNYFNNSITLMKRYRKRMYMQFRYNPGDPEQIWTYYTTPFQSKGLVVYELNLVVIPFGAIDWSIKYDNSSFDYITLATIGSTIAHQIAHHFDANGIFYRSGSRHNTVIFDNNIANSTFVSYTHCQQTNYEVPLTMTLPSTGQSVSYRISQLTLNERLSETMGLRLAYDTLVRLRSRKEVHLPWLDLDSNQLFYLTYAQMHCTKLPLTSSYVSLHEDEHLPSRIRIFATASNSKPLSDAWECPDGSGITPSYSCDVFPYLQTEETPESVPVS